LHLSLELLGLRLKTLHDTSSSIDTSLVEFTTGLPADPTRCRVELRTETIDVLNSRLTAIEQLSCKRQSIDTLLEQVLVDLVIETKIAKPLHRSTELVGVFDLL